MTKIRSQSNEKAKNIFKSRLSVSRLPHEAIKSDTLMSIVKNELKNFNESKETFDITFNEHSSTIQFPTNKTLDNLNLTINTSVISLSNKINNKSRRHSFPLMKKSTIDIKIDPITPRTKKKVKRLKSVGIPKLHRSFIVQNLKKIVTPKTPETFNHVTLRRNNHNKNIAIPKTPQKNDTTIPVKSPVNMSTNDSPPNSPVNSSKDLSASTTLSKSPIELFKNSSVNERPAELEVDLSDDLSDYLSTYSSPVKSPVDLSDDSSVHSSPAKSKVNSSYDSSSTNYSPAKKSVELSGDSLNNKSPAKSKVNSSYDSSSTNYSPAKKSVELSGNSLNNKSPGKLVVDFSNDSSTNDGPAKPAVNSSDNLSENKSPAKSPIKSPTKPAVNSSNDLSKNISPAKPTVNMSNYSSKNSSPSKPEVDLSNNSSKNSTPAKLVVDSSNDSSTKDSPAKPEVDLSNNSSKNSTPVKLVDNSTNDSSTNSTPAKLVTDTSKNSSKNVSPVKAPVDSFNNSSINGSPVKTAADSSNNSTNNVSPAKSDTGSSKYSSSSNSPAKLTIDSSKNMSPAKPAVNLAKNSSTEIDPAQALVDSSTRVSPAKPSGQAFLDALVNSTPAKLPINLSEDSSKNINSAKKNEPNPMKNIHKSILNSNDDDKLLLTPKNACNRSFNSDTEYENMCETINESNHQPTSFTFEAVETLVDTFQENEKLEIDDKVLAGMTSNNKLKVKNNSDYPEDPLSTEPISKKPKMSSTLLAENIYSDDDSLTEFEIESPPKVYNKKTKKLEKKKTRSSIIKEANEFDDLDDDSNDDFNDEKKEKLPISNEMIERLRYIKVELEHEVPKQHKIGTSCSLPLTKKEKLLFKKYEVLKSGAFTRKEDNIIKKNWKRFCDINFLIIDNERFFSKRYNGNIFIKDDKERKKFVQFLANGLPQRPLFSVFKRFERLYEFRRRLEIKSRRYTKDEDKTIIKYFQQKKPAMSKSIILPEILNRPYDSIHRRYFYLKRTRQLEKKHDESMRSIKWTLSLIKSFIKNLLDLTLSTDIIELKDAVIPYVVWEKMEEKMKINVKTLRYFWLHQLHMQLFCPNKIYLNDVKIMLTKYLYKKKITNPTKINWPHIVKYFDGYTKDFLSETLHRMKLKDKEQTKLTYADRRLSFGKFINDLYQIQIDKFKYDIKDRYLPRLAYENGTVKIIDDCLDIIPKLEQDDDDNDDDDE
ncbi:dentin sialophosphoprotein-like, partial [Aphidius gifuensis]|uniref:dentin sialophosphoprotein-like n=1 Tax=Aphidius gifuensis TaxID=684658 RepID=UPI001CDBCBB8